MSEKNTPEIGRKDRGVLCSKCEHLNIWGRNECKRCGAHLYISCSDCGHRNERVRSRCTNCQRRLHHSFIDRVISQVRKAPVHLTGLQVVVFFIGVGLAFGLILFFSSLELPRLF